MAAAARYWRVRLQLGVVGGYISTAISSLKWFTSSAVDMSSTLSAAAIVIAPVGNARSGGTTTNLVDGTVSEVWLATAGNAADKAFTISYDFGTSVLPAFAEITITSTQTDSYSVSPSLNPNLIDVMLFSSPDNVTWNPMTAFDKPIPGYLTPTRLIVEYSAQYPKPASTLVGGSGGIFGIVSEDGVAMPNRGVSLFDRDTMYRLGYATTDEYGGYAFNGLNTEKEFLLLSTDPSGPPYKNAIVWDRIKPINALSVTPLQTGAFWSRRLRDPNYGSSICVTDYIEGTYRNIKTGKCSYGEDTDADRSLKYDFAPVPAGVGGEFRYLVSGRYATTVVNRGAQFILGGGGTPSGRNSSSATENYSNLSFEHICYSPSTGQTPLVFLWNGTRDSDDVPLYGYDVNNAYYGLGAGMCLVLTTDTLTLRCALGSRNLSIVRGTCPILPNTNYHVLVTFELDTAIKVYLNGVLVITALIPATGRIYSWVRSNQTSTSINTEDWDYFYGAPLPNGAVRRFTNLTVTGYGSMTVTLNFRSDAAGPGWGGSFGFAAIYHRTFTAADALTLYDSFANWELHTVPATLSGYMAEVQADSPLMYFPMTETSNQPIQSVTGQRDWRAWYVGTTGFGQVGFAGGRTAVNLLPGPLLIASTAGLGSAFSVNHFIRPVLAIPPANEVLWSECIADNYKPFSFQRDTTGKLALYVRDQANLAYIKFQFVHTTLVAGQDYMLTVTYDTWVSKKVRLYINGVLVSELAGALIFVKFLTNLVHAHCFSLGWDNAGSTRNGATPTYSDPTNAVFGHLAVYGYELSAARIAAQYTARNA